MLLYTIDTPGLDLLEKMVKAIGYKIDEIAILTICGENPAAQAQDQEAVKIALRERIKSVSPRVIIGMGAAALER